MNPRRPWALTRSHLVTWTVVCVALGVASLVPSNAPLNAVGSALISIAGALFITEIILKPIYTNDILEIVGVDHELQQSGLASLRVESQTDLAGFYEHSNGIVAFVSEPQSFRERHWPEIVSAARSRGISVTILVPERGRAASAQLIGLETSDGYDTIVSQMCAAIEQDWRGRVDARLVHAQSQLTIEPIATVPPYGVALTDRGLSIILNPIAPTPTSSRLAIMFNIRGRSHVLDWVRERTGALQSLRGTPYWRSANWQDERELRI